MIGVRSWMRRAQDWDQWRARFITDCNASRKNENRKKVPGYTIISLNDINQLMFFIKKRRNFCEVEAEL
jgi:hypothetical protein